MQIAENKVAVVNYVLRDDEGTILDQSEDGSFGYLHGAQNIITGLENALAGKSAGDEVSVSIAPEDAYGPKMEEAIQEVPRDMFPEDAEIEPGMQFQAQTPEGQMMALTIVEVKEDVVVTDANHPLAGRTLNFEVKIIEVRDATEEEISHGHVHGADGHEEHEL